MKIIIELEVTGAGPAALVDATRISLGCEELQDGIVMVAGNAGHGNVKVPSSEVVPREIAIGGLRDELAKSAMQSLCIHPQFLDADEPKIAEAAYRQADAMLKAREVTP